MNNYVYSLSKVHLSAFWAKLLTKRHNNNWDQSNLEVAFEFLYLYDLRSNFRNFQYFIKRKIRLVHSIFRFFWSWWPKTKESAVILFIFSKIHLKWQLIFFSFFSQSDQKTKMEWSGHYAANILIINTYYELFYCVSFIIIIWS